MNILVAMPRRYYGHDAYGVVLNTGAMKKLKTLGRVFECPEGFPESYPQALAEARAEAVITFWGSPRLTLPLYRAHPHLKYLCHLGGAIRGVVDRDVLQAGLAVTNWGNLVANSVAEAALMMILAALRRVTRLQFEMHVRKEWHGSVAVGPESLFGNNVGLHGLGGIAQELVKLLVPFRCRIAAYSPHCPDSVFAEHGVKRVETLEELYSGNRIISVHASKTDKNFHIVNAALLARMPDNGLIVNTARGAVIDTDALVAELKTGRIHAALDVYETEPLQADHPLRGLENCMLIPHHGGPLPDRYPELAELCVAQIVRYMRGEKLDCLVPPEKYDLIT